ncbi:MAG: BON domain-containing protein [Rhodanobacteraceae bacterium]
MKTPIAAAIASLLLASLGSVAYAQAPQQQMPQQTPQQTMPQQQPAPPMTAGDNAQANQNGTSSNSQIENKVKHELTSHGVTATDVNVSFDNGTATLSGTVYTQRDIAKAKKAAMRVHGVKQVDTSNLHARKSGSSKHHQS